LNKEAEAPQKPVYSNSDFSIIAGYKIKGWPIMTMLRGRIVAQDGNVIAETGEGMYIPGR
jgi:dihydropyrimidinase